MFKLRQAFQAVTPPTLDPVIRFLKNLPATVYDVDELINSEIGQAYASIKSKRVKALVTDKNIAKNGETATNRNCSMIDLFGDMRAYFYEAYTIMYIADHNAHGVLPILRRCKYR